MYLCTEVAAVFTLSVPREAKAMDVSAWAPMSFGVMQGGPSGDTGEERGPAAVQQPQMPPGVEAPWKVSAAVTLISHGGQGIVSRLPRSSSPCGCSPADPGAVFGCAELAGSFIANVGTSAPAWTQSGGWQQGGCTLQQSIQTLHYLSLWQDFSGPPLHFP